MTISGPDHLTTVRLRFPVTFSVVTSAGLLALTAGYFWQAQSIKETLVFFLAGAAAVGQITASFYTARMLAATLAIRDDDLSRQSKVTDAAASKEAKLNALEFGRRWNDPHMYQVRDMLREILDHTGSHDELIAVIREKKTSVISILNFLEEIATASVTGHSDDELLHRQFSSVILNTWRKTSHWIQVHRSERGDTEIWEDLERVYGQWNQRR